MQQYNTAHNQALALSFNGVNLSPVEREGQIWMTSADLAQALGYKETDSITRIYNRNKGEFSESMTTTVISNQTSKLTASLKTRGLTVKTRIFSLRGCHMIAMFARTDVAKSFRKWVLDILDREVGAPVPEQPPAITDADWVRYARSMTIPEMVQLTGYNEREVVNALHKVIGSAITTTSPAPVLTPELQYALDRFWGFIATQDIATLNHSHKSHELAISIPEVYALSDQCQWQLPDTSLVYKALRLSNTPRFHRANTVIASVIGHKSRRVWIFIKSFNQTVIANKEGQ